MTKFGATVRSAGGGLIQLAVDRDTEQYPGVGDHVTVEVDVPLEPERDWRYFSEALAWYPYGYGLTGGQTFSVVLQIKQALRDGRIAPADLGIGTIEHG